MPSGGFRAGAGREILLAVSAAAKSNQSMVDSAPALPP